MKLLSIESMCTLTCYENRITVTECITVARNCGPRSNRGVRRERGSVD